MRWSDLPFHPSIGTLRQFAGLWMLFFGGSAVWRWVVHDEPSRGIVLALVSCVGLVGLIRPSLMRPLFVGWMVAAFPIGWVISRVMLVIVFYGVFTPMGLVFRAMGRDVLHLKRLQSTSYWMSKPRASTGRSYYRQF